MAEIEVSKATAAALLATGWATIATDGALELTPLGSHCLRAYCERALTTHAADLSRLDTDFDVPRTKCDEAHTVKA